MKSVVKSLAVVAVAAALVASSVAPAVARRPHRATVVAPGDFVAVVEDSVPFGGVAHVTSRIAANAGSAWARVDCLADGQVGLTAFARLVTGEVEEVRIDVTPSWAGGAAACLVEAIDYVDGVPTDLGLGDSFEVTAP